MFHKALTLKFLKGTELEVEFYSGEIKRYDMSNLFSKYPRLKVLNDRDFFLSGKLMGQYGIIWNDDIDIDVETIFEDGILVKTKNVELNRKIGNLICEFRNSKGLSQNDLSKLCNINQSDISKLERGITNPSIGLLERVCDALDLKFDVTIKGKG